MAEKTPNQQLAEKLLFKPAYVGDKSAAVKQEAQKQGHQPRRHPVLCPASPALSAAPRSGFSFPFCHVRSSLSFL